MQHTQRQSLIGRETELEQLVAGLAEARAGHGSACSSSRVHRGSGRRGSRRPSAGEAETEGMLVAWGRCWENPGAPAYWPWTQALRALIDGRDAESLHEDLGRRRRLDRRDRSRAS